MRAQHLRRFRRAWKQSRMHSRRHCFPPAHPPIPGSDRDNRPPRDGPQPAPSEWIALPPPHPACRTILAGQPVRVVPGRVRGVDPPPCVPLASPISARSRTSSGPGCILRCRDREFPLLRRFAAQSGVRRPLRTAHRRRFDTPPPLKHSGARPVRLGRRRLRIVEFAATAFAIAASVAAARVGAQPAKNRSIQTGFCRTRFDRAAVPSSLTSSS